jgi:acetyl-CoA acyltransferase
VIKVLVGRIPVLPPDSIDDVIFGCVNQAGEDNRNFARMAALLAGLPDTVPGTTIGRLFGSAPDAVLTAARTIAAADADLIIAGGVESVSRAPFVIPKSEQPFGRRTEIHDRLALRRSPARRAVRVRLDAGDRRERGGRFGISREDQDAFALRSQERAAAATASGRLAKETIPVTVPLGEGGPPHRARRAPPPDPRRRPSPACPPRSAEAAR